MLQRPFKADTFIADRKSFAKFRADAMILSEGDRSKVFALLVQIHLRTSPVYRNLLDPVAIWMNAEVPADVRSSLKLPDAGIDIVARTRGGEFWAVRTAFVEPGAAVSARQAAAFGTLVHRKCRNVSHALLVHTAADAIPGLDKRTGQIGLSDWSSLGQAGWRRIRDGAKGLRRKRPKAKKARPHQVRVVADARKHFRHHVRGRLVMPCGTGKSLAGILIADALGAKAIVVAAPSLGLIRQNLAGWAEQFDATGRTFDCLCICSDQTVADGGDRIVEDPSGLGIEVMTDIKEIADRLRRPRNRPLVVFTTYHSSPLLADGARQAKFAFDLAILDEAHKTAGAVDRAFATLLDEGRVKVAKRLFMTATERVYRGDRDDVLSMDDETVYGACFHHLSFKAAIEQRLICDYKIITFFVGEAEIRELIEQETAVDVAHEGDHAFTDANAMSLAAGIALKRAVRDYGVRHTISFHRSIKAADKFREQQDRLDRFSKLGPASTNLHVSGAFSTAVRNEIMERFAAAEIGCVSNARCLTEGIDVPRTDCILFEGPKQSIIDIAQAAGRAMRLFPGKKFGYILVPVVVPEGMEFDEFAATTQFRKVAQTLTAMSTQDERLAVEFRGLADGRPPDGGGIVIVEGSDSLAVGMEFGKFANAIRAKVWRTMARAHWRPFAEARDFARGLGLKSMVDWKRFATTSGIPDDIPKAPDTTYRDWAGWGDWLATGRTVYVKKPMKGTIRKTPRGKLRAFKEARTFVRGLGLKNTREWKAFARSNRMPLDIPNAADRIYAEKGWAGWGDWLGTGAVADKNRKWRPFTKARTYVRGLGLKGADGWREFVRSGRKPSDIPAHPELTYADDGFSTMGDFLGSKVNSKPRPFKEARAFVRSLGLKSLKDWVSYCKSGQRPADIPSNPNLTYASSGWNGIPDWLGYCS
jgi:superfamily II DNA or RNA helicase